MQYDGWLKMLLGFAAVAGATIILLALLTRGTRRTPSDGKFVRRHQRRRFPSLPTHRSAG
jgi:hypothetical protein